MMFFVGLGVGLAIGAWVARAAYIRGVKMTIAAVRNEVISGGGRTSSTGMYTVWASPR